MSDEENKDMFRDGDFDGDYRGYFGEVDADRGRLGAHLAFDGVLRVIRALTRSEGQAGQSEVEVAARIVT